MQRFQMQYYKNATRGKQQHTLWAVDFPKLSTCVTQKLILFLLVTRQQQAAKADPRHIMNNKFRAASAATPL